ncbi:MAG: TIGR02391 family protein [Planctomycetes bacterium RBG_13_62_9]|nr:MAG: TIGR02391 family protein [Planctomycetes bacterium RBG_13_62_9]
MLYESIESVLDQQGVLMTKKRSDPEPIEPREFRSVDEIDVAIAKIKRRIGDLELLDLPTAVFNDTGADNVVRSDVRETIREVFGTNSPEFHQHKHISLWVGHIMVGMPKQEIVAGLETGRRQMIVILNGLISRLKEKKEDLSGVGTTPAPSTYFDRLNLHPRILDVSRELFLDGYHWEAVFAAAKALVNYIKERSGRHDLDGAPLVRTVFSRNAPLLAFNDLSDATDQDEQEGMMHLFEGAILGIRNPGGHSFPEGPEQRAIEYMSLLSLLAYRVQEATRPRKPQ